MYEDMVDSEVLYSFLDILDMLLSFGSLLY